MLQIMQLMKFNERTQGSDDEEASKQFSNVLVNLKSETTMPSNLQQKRNVLLNKSDSTSSRCTLQFTNINNAMKVGRKFSV